MRAVGRVHGEDEQTISQRAAQPVFNYYSALILLLKVRAGCKGLERREDR